MASQPSAPSATRHVFLALDLLRGIAALIIAMGHAEILFGFHPGSGYLSVDLFFVLSGFVLAYAYDNRIAGGMSVSRFMAVRLIRLYPLYFLALACFSFALLLAYFVGGHTSWSPGSLAVAGILALCFLPTPGGIGPRDAIYPLNTPAWSLAFELIVNFVFVAVWRFLSIRVLSITVAAAGAALIVSACYYGSLATGSNWATALGGFPRVFFSFPLGVLLFRLYDRHNFRLPGGTLPPLLAMLVVLCVEPTQAFRALYDLVCVLLVFPPLVLAAASAKPGKFAFFCHWIGGISYAVYALHFPIFEFTLSLLKKAVHDDLAPLRPWAGVAFIVAVSLVAHLADLVVDVPARKWLSARLPRRCATAPGRS